MSDDLKFIVGLLLAYYIIFTFLLSGAVIRQREEILDLQERVQQEKEAKESFKRAFNASLELLNDSMKNNR